MVYQFISEHLALAHWLYFAFGFLLPTLFFGAILAWTLADGKYLSRQPQKAVAFSHSEPVVLLLIGAIFSYINRGQLQALPVAALLRITSEPDVSRCISPGLIAFAYFTYTIATLTIFASLAKAFWTHVRLEQGCWGRLDYYEAFKSHFGLLRLLELSLRCGIALLVVFLQKHLFLLRYVTHIDKINNPLGIEQRFEAEFLASFANWQGEFGELFMAMYVAILLWSVLAWQINKSDDRTKTSARNWAFLWTLLSTAPGLVIAWLLYFTATGHLLPFGGRPVDIPWWVIVVASSAFALFSLIILFDLVIVLIKQVYPVVAEAYQKPVPEPAA